MLTLTLGLLGGQPAWADLSSQFSGFESVNEVGVSGLQSSYNSPTSAGNLCPATMPVLGASRVVYPNGVGAVPSPGNYAPATAALFDEGMLGIQVQGGNLVVRLATGINPATGYQYGSNWFDQGDVFITVGDTSGVKQFALLNDWGAVSGNSFTAAQTFHTGRQGDLVQIINSGQVTATGGAAGYPPGGSSPPTGLDYRCFANGGTDLGNAGLTISTVAGTGFNGTSLTWYVETWTLPVSQLSSNNSFDISLHSAFSCGNDQIGLTSDVNITHPPDNPTPTPAAVVLGLLGLSALGVWMRRYA